MKQLSRRDFVARGALAAAGVAGARRLWAAGPAELTVQIHADRAIASIPPGFLGLGYEISSVAVPGLLTGRNRFYVQLLRTLATEGVVRVGGNTSDNGARYGAQTAARSGPEGTVVNDAVLHDLGSFLDATGWKLLWGLNLGTGSEKEAVAEVRAVQEAVGSNLLAFQIGNEPDLFPNHHRKSGYSYDEWLKEFVRYRDALRKGLGHDVRLAGPDAAGNTQWVTRFAHDEGRHIRLLTEHFYRGNAHDPDATIATLLAPDPRLASMLSQLRTASDSSGVPYRICEVNSYSGGGRAGVSDTLASALWVLDFLYTVAGQGGAGVNMETGVNQLGTISAYSPIANNPAGQPEVRPEYYGMLAFAQGGSGAVVQAECSSPHPGISAYATRQVGHGLHVTLLNRTASAVKVRAQVVGGTMQGNASVVRLQGGTLAATAGVTLGGSAITSLGFWQPATEEFLPVTASGLSLSLPPASAAVVTLS